MPLELVPLGHKRLKMFDVTFLRAKTLRDIVDALGELVTDALFEVAEDGLRLLTMDSSHVCMLDLLLSSTDTGVFSSFRGDEPTTFGVSVVSLRLALRGAGKDSCVRMALGPTADTLSIDILSTSRDDAPPASAPDPSQAHLDVGFSLRLREVDAVDFRPPADRDAHALRFTTAAADFGRTVRDLAGIGDTLSIRMDDDAQMEWTCDGQVGRARVKFGSAPEPMADADGSERESVVVVQSFSLRYMLAISKACVLADTVTLISVDGRPMCFEFPLRGSVSGGVGGDPPRTSRLRCFLAPKIDEGEGEGEGEGVQDLDMEALEI